MNEQVRACVERFPAELVALYGTLRQLIYDSVSCEVTETLWARLPSYTNGDAFVRLIPFRDHINIEAQAALRHTGELAGCRITPKGMVQIFLKQEIPCEALGRIFAETLEA